MSQPFNRFDILAKNIVDGVHDFDGHVFKVMLTNVAPVVSNETRSQLTELSGGNGYTAGGAVTSITTSRSGATAKITAADVVFTASGGSMGPFRYLVAYNDTPTSPADPLIGWWDYGQSVTLADGETFTADFNATTGIITI